MSATINLTETTANNPKQIEAGQYLLAVSGIPSSQTVDIRINVGDARGVAITDAQFDADGTKVVWLPNCTVYAAPSFPVPVANYGVALAELSTKLENT